MDPGDRVDRFLVEAPLGRGGMASVYRVRHATLGSAHALKVLDLQFPSVRERLVLEGRVQAGLAHPNIVAVTDLVDVGGAPGLIMEYVPGPSLDVWLRTNRPDPATADALFRGILDAVGHAHRGGLVHRDLKPGNVLLQTVDGRLVPKVSDFGLVKLLTDDPGQSHTRSGFAMGTPGYMAPEQIRSAKDVDARADVFALGCILYELWCGRRPFDAAGLFDVLVAIEKRAYPDPRSLRPDLPRGVERAIAGCLAPERADRLPSVDAIRALLDADRGAGSISPGPAVPGPPLPPPASTLPPEVGEAPGTTGTPGVADPAAIPAVPARPTPRPQRRGSTAWIWVIALVVVGLVLLGALAFVGVGVLAGLLTAAADTGF